MSRQLISAVVLIVTGAPVAALGGTTWYVNGTCGNNAWSGASSICAAPDGPKATIQAAIVAASIGDEVVVADGVYTGPGNRDLNVGQIVLRSANGPQGCVIDCQGAGRAFSLGDAEIQGITVTNGSAQAGGVAWIVGGSQTFRGCVFTDNVAMIGGAIRQETTAGTLRLIDCTFAGNTGTVSTGGVQAFGSEFIAEGCVFVDNNGGSGPGAVAHGAGGLARYVSCTFANNSATFVGGGLAEGGPASAVNCLFSGNSSPLGGGVITGGEVPLINCTIEGNQGGGIDSTTNPGAILTNSVAWGNTPVQFSGGSIVVSWSDVQGGWPGTGNINADPLFVQPGTGDLRLSIGSPCVNAGSNAALPADEFDLDGDGDTAEPVPLDLAGGLRVINAVVDMGAYEGEFASSAPAAGESDLDEGEFVILVPEGGALDPVAHSAVIMTNVSGGDNGTVTVTQIDGTIHSAARGYTELGSVMVLVTSLGDGSFLATVIIPFDSGALGWATPDRVRATWYDPSAGVWVLAASGNVNNSPGHPGPIGDRYYAEAPAGWGLTQDVGDSGVFWDPVAGQGFAWVNVDHSSDFGIGVTSCPEDCQLIPDGRVTIVDLLALLVAWGPKFNGPCDVDGDGGIGGADLVVLLANWGPCAKPAMAAPAGAARDRLRIARAAPAGSADLDASGTVDRIDLEMVMSCWGNAERGCQADLDGDGTVGVRDYLGLLAAWGEATAP